MVSWVNYTHDELGDQTSESDGGGTSVAETAYDALGRVTWQTVGYDTAAAATTSYTYDEASNVLTVTTPLGTWTCQRANIPMNGGVAGLVQDNKILPKDVNGNVVSWEDTTGFTGKGQKKELLASEYTNVFLMDTFNVTAPIMAPGGNSITAPFSFAYAVNSVKNASGTSVWVLQKQAILGGAATQSWWKDGGRWASPLPHTWRD